MKLDFVLDRTEQYLRILQSTIIQKPLRIDTVSYHEGRDPEGEWKSFPKGGYWGKNDTWYRFRASVTIPGEYAGNYVRCRLITGREGAWNPLNPQLLVRINGEVCQALDTNHSDFCLSFSAEPGRKYELDFEAYAGREYDNRSFSELPLRFELSVYCHERLSEKLYYDLYAAQKAAEMFPETDYRRIQIENYLTSALNMVDCRIPSSEDYFASVQCASDYLQREFYEKFCGKEDVIANIIGHTHIDVAWMWRLEQTRAKACRSFATELELMKEYPEHRFLSSQPQLYQFVKEDCPEIYEQIKERVREGRWEVEGAMWLEADCNLTSGESLIRQILHGKRFMEQEFGVESHILWLPDVFGYSAALPQILTKSGVDTFVTSKISWNETNHFPYDTFIWKGIDGTEIFTQYLLCGEPHVKLGDGVTFSCYNGMVLPIAQAKGWEIYQQKGLNNELLVTVGYGDGGGGVTREMLEMNRRMRYGLPGTPKTRLTTAGDALSRIRKNAAGKKLPKWFGDLYLEMHRGTYTSIGKNKNYNRRSEFLMQQVETLSVIDKCLISGSYPKEAIYADWTTVLLNQFHDIIPGSSIREVYMDSQKQYEDLLSRNTSLSAAALARLAEACGKRGILVYNPTGVFRDGVVEVEGVKYFVKDVPALGWKTIAASESIASNPLAAAPGHMENQFYSIDLDETGCLTSIYDKRSQREVLTGRGNVLRAYDDHPRCYDNWELTNYYEEKMWEMDDVEDVFAQCGETAAEVHIRRRFLNSTLEQVVTIYRDMPGIEFKVNADWHEHHIFVKAAFPVDILSDKATYEIQYGALERPAHANTSWDAAKFEVCAQKWADYGEAGYGIALINDCKYGYSIRDGLMQLSLIKCGTYPNPEADQGYHTMRYRLIPHDGDWRTAGIPNQAYAFNCPLLAAKTSGTGSLPDSFSFITADRPNIIITTVKEACDSEEIIIRVYEAYGKRTRVGFTLGVDVGGTCEVDMMERKVVAEKKNVGRGFQEEFKPYEIKTYRVALSG